MPALFEKPYFRLARALNFQAVPHGRKRLVRQRAKQPAIDRQKGGLHDNVS
jgi:hypothetical protein